MSPVYNEADNLDAVARAVAEQERPPDRWVIVDDGSADDTLATALRWERELSFLRVIATEKVDRFYGRDRLAVAKEARAFNVGLESAGWRSFSFIGKLDGDVELPPSWFATLLEQFESEPGLGIAGGRLEEHSPAGWRRIPIPSTHVHGAVKLYRRACLEQIGGVPTRLAWDTIDETYARMLGWETRSMNDLSALHHRPWASADGRLRGCARHGECAWILHQPPPWALLRSCKLSRRRPYVLSGAAFAYGYARAAARRIPQVEDPGFRHFVRAETRARVLGPLRRKPARRPLVQGNA